MAHCTQCVHMAKYWNIFSFFEIKIHTYMNNPQICEWPIPGKLFLRRSGWNRKMNFGGFLQRLNIFSKFVQNEPKGPYFGLKWSNQPSIEYYQKQKANFRKKAIKIHYLLPIFLFWHVYRVWNLRCTKKLRYAHSWHICIFEWVSAYKLWF